MADVTEHEAIASILARFSKRNAQDRLSAIAIVGIGTDGHLVISYTGRDKIALFDATASLMRQVEATASAA